MGKEVLKISHDNIKMIVERTIKSLLKENYQEENPNVMQELEMLKNKMGASFVDYDDSNGLYIIESSSSLPLKYIFKDNNGKAMFIKVVGYEEFKQAYNEINIVNNYVKGGQINTIK